MEAGSLKRVEELEEGPFGRCFRAVDERDGTQLVVVETATSGLSPGDIPCSLARVIEETRRLTRAFGGGLVQVRSLTTRDESIEVVFEPPTGITLEEWLAQGPRSRSDVIEVSRSLLAAVAEAHALDVPHRSLSARDVVTSPDNSVTVTGFGLTRVAAWPAETSAPEVASGEPATAATDQFNLGRLLARMAESAEPELDIECVVATACALRPDRRFADLFDMAAAFETTVQAQRAGVEREVNGPPIPPSHRRRWLRPTPTLAIIGGVLVLASATAAISLRAGGHDRPVGAARTADVQMQHGGQADDPGLLEQAERLIRMNELAEARPLLEAALANSDLQNPAAVHATLGTIHLKLGDIDDAIVHLRRATEIDPRAESFYRLALALASAGKTNEAREAIDAGLRVDPDHAQLVDARNRLGG